MEKIFKETNDERRKAAKVYCQSAPRFGVGAWRRGRGTRQEKSRGNRSEARRIYRQRAGRCRIGIDLDCAEQGSKKRRSRITAASDILERDSDEKFGTL